MSPVTIVNFFEIEPDKLDAFITLQQAYAASLCDKPTGLIGGRLYRGRDGRSAVLISQFDSQEAQTRIRESDAFQQHIAKLRALIVSTSPKLYDEAYTAGGFS
jgi:quinol monooxygenase YgiN